MMKRRCFFIYRFQGRIAATTTIPKVSVGTYDWATVCDVKAGTGIFLDIGIQKDMLLGEEDLTCIKAFGQSLEICFLSR